MATQSKTVGITILLSYLILRIGLDDFWGSIHPYYAYLFEVVFVAICFFLFRRRISFRLNGLKDPILDLSIPLVAGWLVHTIIRGVKIPVPFQFESLEIIILLLVVAPILEELIFRMALWEALRNLYSNTVFLVFSSGVLFSLGHALAYWRVPETYQSFVLLQTIYTLFLGFIAGVRRNQSDSVVPPILIHFGFNLGFLLAAKFALI